MRQGDIGWAITLDDLTQFGNLVWSVSLCARLPSVCVSLFVCLIIQLPDCILCVKPKCGLLVRAVFWLCRTLFGLVKFYV